MTATLNRAAVATEEQANMIPDTAASATTTAEDADVPFIKGITMWGLHLHGQRPCVCAILDVILFMACVGRGACGMVEERARP